MKKVFFFFFILILLTSCSKRVIYDDSSISPLNQVDLEKHDPLDFYNKNYKLDSISLFYTFQAYNKKYEIKEDTSQPTKINYVYYVQVGLTDDYPSISNLLSKIKELFPGEQSEVVYTPPFYRIVIGPYPTKKEANEIFSILEEKKYSSLNIITEIAE